MKKFLGSFHKSNIKWELIRDPLCLSLLLLASRFLKIGMLMLLYGLFIFFFFFFFFFFRRFPCPDDNLRTPRPIALKFSVNIRSTLIHPSIVSGRYPISKMSAGRHFGSFWACLWRIGVRTLTWERRDRLPWNFKETSEALSYIPLLFLSDIRYPRWPPVSHFGKKIGSLFFSSKFVLGHLKLLGL